MFNSLLSSSHKINVFKNKLIMLTGPQGLKFVKAIFIYGVGQFAMKGLDVLSFAMLVSTLTPAEFGFVGTMLLLAFTVTDLTCLGVLRISVPRFFVDKEHEPITIMRNGLGAFLIYAGLLTVLLPLWLLIVQKSFGAVYLLPFVLYGLSFIIRSLVYMELEVLRMQEKAVLQSAFEAAPSLLNFVALICLLPLFRDKLFASAIAQVIAWTPLFLLSVFAFAMTRGGPQFKLIVHFIKYSAPLVVHRSMSDLSQMGGRWVTLFLFGLPGVGMYTFLSRTGEILKMALMPMQKAWLPVLLNSVKKDDPKGLGRLAIFYVVASTGAFILFVLTYRYIAHLIDHRGQYKEYYGCIPLVATGVWLTSYYMIFGVGFLVAKKTAEILPITAAATVINLGTSFILGKYFGISAIPYGVVISSAVFTFFSQWKARKYFNIEYRPTWVITFISIALGISMIMLQIIFKL